MKACVLSDWEKLEILDLPMPELADGEVLVEVLYGGVCGSDVTVFHHRHPTATAPRILCHEILGRVKKINTDAPVPYKVGDKVCVFLLRSCGNCPACLTGHTSACSSLKVMGLHIDGGFAEYCKAPADCIIPVREELPNTVAALTEPFSVAFHACARAGVKPGDKVLVIGAGPIGLLSALTARYFGGKVTVSEIKKERLALAEEFGLDTLDPTEHDVFDAAREITGGVGFDVVLEVTGSQAGYDTMIKVCRECGTIVPVAIPSQPRAIQPNLFILKEIHLLGTRCCPKDEFARAAEMVWDLYKTEGLPMEKLVAKILPLEEVGEGLALQESGRCNGKVLIRIGGE